MMSILKQVLHFWSHNLDDIWDAWRTWSRGAHRWSLSLRQEVPQLRLFGWGHFSCNTHWHQTRSDLLIKSNGMDGAFSTNLLNSAVLLDLRWRCWWRVHVSSEEDSHAALTWWFGRSFGCSFQIGLQKSILQTLQFTVQTVKHTEAGESWHPAATLSSSAGVPDMFLLLKSPWYQNWQLFFFFSQNIAII